MKKTTKKSDTVRHIELVTRLKDNDGNILFDMDKIKEVIEKKQHVIKDYCYIIHDKDTYEETNEKHEEGELKSEHLHLLLQFRENQPQKRKYIAKWFDVAENFLQDVSSWKGACLYLIHFYHKDKYQYDVSEVTANFDYKALVEEAQNKESKKAVPALNIIISKIMNGEIKEYKRTEQIDCLTLVRYSRQIENAFRYYAERQQITRKERDTAVLFITGSGGVGKTTLAKKIAESKGLDYYVSSGSNDIMDGYAMQPCLIADDIRPSCLGLSDLLKMLDPNTASSVKSRYKNKYLNCELVILTTVLDIDTFYKNVFTENDEPIIQLKRRCETYIKMNMDEICVSVWDKAHMRYTNPVCYKNTLLTEYVPKERITEEDVIDHVADLMPFLEQSDTSDFTFGMGVTNEASDANTSNTSHYISDENFEAIMPRLETVNKEKEK